MARKIAANYIYLPGKPLVKNSYVVVEEGQPVVVADTGGVLQDLAGLEFYGGMLVADFVYGREDAFTVGEPLLPVLEALYAGQEEVCGIVLIEGADLRHLQWQAGARIRKL